MLLSAGVLVNMVLGVEKCLSLLDRHVNLDPSLGLREADPFSVDAALQQPVVHGIDGVKARRKYLRHLRS